MLALLITRTYMSPLQDINGHLDFNLAVISQNMHFCCNNIFDAVYIWTDLGWIKD